MKNWRLFVFICTLLIPSLLSAQEQYYHETYWQKNSQEVCFYQGFSYQEGNGLFVTPNQVHFDSFLRYIIYLEENRATLDGVMEFYGFNLDGVLEVPDHIQYKGVDYPVTEVKRVSQSQKLKTIICPATVTFFGGVRSQYNPELQSVILKGVRKIGYEAFKDCTFSIELPSSLEIIAERSFEGCTSIKDLSLERVDRIEEGAFTNSSLRTLSLGSVGCIENNAFTNADSLESVSIAEYTTEKLSEKAFYDCNSLKSVSLGEGLKTIGQYAFAGCQSLEEVSLPQSLEILEDGVFFDRWTGRQCPVLKKINFPKGLKSIGEAVFRYTAIEELPLLERLVDLGRYVFAETSLKSAKLPESLTYIPEWAFYECTDLEEVNIPTACTDIGAGAFQRCKRVKSFDIPPGITAIRYDTFWGCESLETIELPGSVEKIEDRAFNACRSLRTFSFLSSPDMPSMLNKIGEHAFSNCYSLHEIYLPEGVETIGRGAFINCEALESFTFPATMKKLGYVAFLGANKLKDIYCRSFFEAEIQDGFGHTPFFYKDSPRTDIILHVPNELKQLFHDTYPWSYFTIVDMETGEPFVPSENPSEKVCAKPSIAIDNGELIFTCETEDVEYVTTITCDDVGTLVHKENIKLAASYIITSYAKREGYKNSETVKATLFWLSKGIDEEIGIDEAVISSRPVLISSDGGTLTIQGTEAGDMITVCDLLGRRLSSAKANGAVTSIATTLKKGDTAIVRIGEKSMKVLID